MFKNKLNNIISSELLKKCSNCSMCRESCPMYESMKRETAFAGGRMRVIRTFCEEGLTPTQELMRVMALCTTCSKCEEVCPISLNYTAIIEKVRKLIISNANLVYEPQKKYSVHILAHKNPYGENFNQRSDWTPENVNINNQSSIAYFVGCTSSYREKVSARNTARILTHILKEGFQLLGEQEYCCGSPLIRTGQIQYELEMENSKRTFSVKDLIEHNIKALSERGIKKIITNCSGCYKTIKEDWPEIMGKELPFECVHLTEFLQKEIQKEKLRFKEYKTIVTYHDPCHLGRHMGIYEAPRVILQAIPNLKFIEMPNNRKNAICCGAGGGVKGVFPNEAIDIAKKRIEEALEIGVEKIITACVFCKKNLIDALLEMDAHLEILNIEDLVVDLL